MHTNDKPFLHYTKHTIFIKYIYKILLYHKLHMNLNIFNSLFGSIDNDTEHILDLKNNFPYLNICVR